MSSKYQCCDLSFENYSEMVAHLSDAHGVDVKTQQFTKEFISHVDALDWYSDTFRWTCDKVTFTQMTLSIRERDCPMRGEVKE